MNIAKENNSQDIHSGKLEGFRSNGSVQRNKKQGCLSHRTFEGNLKSGLTGFFQSLFNGACKHGGPLGTRQLITLNVTLTQPNGKIPSLARPSVTALYTFFYLSNAKEALTESVSCLCSLGRASINIQLYPDTRNYDYLNLQNTLKYIARFICLELLKSFTKAAMYDA